MEELLAQVTFEPWPPRQVGGQQVGCGPSGVRAIHPMGLEAFCNTERSQHKNKIIALEMIEWGLSKYVSR